MTRTRISVYAFIFLAFSLVGVALAYTMRQREVVAAPAATPSYVPLTVQHNLLVIHVDDLTAGSPHLVSVWAVLFAQHDRTYVSFKALYPDPLSPRPILPVSTRFSLDASGVPSESFLRWVREHRIEWSAYLLIDQAGLDQLAAHSRSPQLEPIVPRSKDELQSVWNQEARLMKHLCSQPAREDVARLDLDWPALIPDHLRTDMTFAHAMLVWDLVSDASAPPHCEVYGLN